MAIVPSYVLPVQSGAKNNGAQNLVLQNLSVLPVPLVPATSFAKPFPDIFKIEIFAGQNFKRWQERIHYVLDMHGVGSAFTDLKPQSVDHKVLDTWAYANKGCKHTIISTLSNDMFDVDYSYKEAKEIWDSMIAKYIDKDAIKQKFAIRNYSKWEMKEEKNIKIQINKYQKLLEDLKTIKIILPDEFVASLLIQKLLDSWKDYKHNLKHKHKPMSFAVLITHIIIEDTNEGELKASRTKEMTTGKTLAK